MYSISLGLYRKNRKRNTGSIGKNINPIVTANILMPIDDVLVRMLS